MENKPNLDPTFSQNNNSLEKTKKPKSNLSLNIILSFLLIFSTALAGFFYWQNMRLKSMLAENIKQEATSTPIPTPSATPDPTANWKTYTSDEISFKYPRSLTLKEKQKDYLVLLSNPQSPQSVAVSIDARLTNNYADYNNAVISTKKGLADIQTQEMDNGVKISGKIKSGQGKGQQITIALFKYQEGGIEAETTSTDSAQLQIFDQILSTFKFLEASSPTPSTFPITPPTP